MPISYEELLSMCDKLEKENPGKTIVLSLETGKPIVISDAWDELISKAEAHLKEIGPVMWVGGPYPNSEMSGMHGQGCSVESNSLDNYE